jgi:hypothetical protein
MNKPLANTNSQDSPWPKLGGNHHLLPYSILCACPWGQHPNVILSQDSQVGVLKFPNLGFSQFWKPITLCVNLWLRWGLKQSCSPCQDLSNNMCHVICTQRNQGDSWLLMVRSQIDNLTPDLSFGHNLCFKCPNGWCKPILDIYVLKASQWYNKIFNPMSFDPCKSPLKIWESIRTPTPKVKAHFGMWGFIPSHFLTLLGG